MLCTIAAIGKLKAGPESNLFERYLSRSIAAGKKTGLTFAHREFSESRADSAASRKIQEATSLLSTAPVGAVVVALDEGGKAITSEAFAARLGSWRDGGTGTVIFAIGGQDGHAPALLDRAALRLAFGAMTWPHQLARVMLAEQLYRAVTILSGHPYHRS